MKSAHYLTNNQLTRRWKRYLRLGFPVPIDVQGEMIRRGLIKL